MLTSGVVHDMHQDVEQQNKPMTGFLVVRNEMAVPSFMTSTFTDSERRKGDKKSLSL